MKITKLLAASAIVAASLAFTLPAYAEAESDDPIIMVQNNWTSQLVLSFPEAFTLLIVTAPYERRWSPLSELPVISLNPFDLMILREDVYPVYAFVA